MSKLHSETQSIGFEGGELVITPQGISFPVPLFVPREQAQLSLQKRTDVVIEWSAIKSWRAVRLPYDTAFPWLYNLYFWFLGVDIHDWYQITLKDYSPVLGARSFRINRKLLRENEKVLVKAAQPYLAFKFAPTDANVKFTRIALLLALFLGIVFLIFKMKQCNMFDIECLKDSWRR